LHAVETALAGFTDTELDALIDATNRVPQVALGLLAWIEMAGIWEWHRRRRTDYGLQPPEAAIPPEERSASMRRVRCERRLRRIRPLCSPRSMRWGAAHRRRHKALTRRPVPQEQAGPRYARSA